MGKILYLDLISKKLDKVLEIEEYYLETYKENDESSDYSICAHVYPSDYAYESMGGIRGDGETDVAVYLDLQYIIQKKCRWMFHHKKIDKFIMEDKPIIKDDSDD